MQPDTDLPVVPPGAKPGDKFPPDDKILNQLGFRGLRRTEINVFARPFVENGAIDRYPEDMAMVPLVTLMESYMMQGKFGEDPFGTRGPQDEIEELKKRLARMEALVGNRTEPAPVEDVPVPVTNPALAHPSDPTLPEDSPNPDSPPPNNSEKPGTKAIREYRELQAKARDLGIETWRKKKVVLIAEIEAAQDAAEMKAIGRDVEGD